MRLGIEFESGVSDESRMREAPAGPAATTRADIYFTQRDAAKLRNLKPNTRVTITLRGTVTELTQEAAEGAAGTVGSLCMTVTELSASRGSEFEELLDEGE